MRAIKLIETDEWVKFINETGEIGTCAIPDILSDTATLEGLKSYYEEYHRTLDITRLKMYEIEINIIKEIE